MILMSEVKFQNSCSIIVIIIEITFSPIPKKGKAPTVQNPPGLSGH